MLSLCHACCFGFWVTCWCKLMICVNTFNATVNLMTIGMTQKSSWHNWQTLAGSILERFSKHLPTQAIPLDINPSCSFVSLQLLKRQHVNICSAINICTRLRKFINQMMKFILWLYDPWKLNSRRHRRDQCLSLVVMYFMGMLWVLMLHHPKQTRIFTGVVGRY